MAFCVFWLNLSRACYSFCLPTWEGRFLLVGIAVAQDRQCEKQKNWTPGEPLTAHDRKLLKPLLLKAAELGYTPSQAEVPYARRIKKRFCTWSNAVDAADLPWVNNPEQHKLRAQARRQRRQSERARPQGEERVEHEDETTMESS